MFRELVSRGGKAKLVKLRFFGLMAILLLAVVTAPLSAIELSSVEERAIDRWLEDQGLNPYGDPAGTVYLGGSPLFDEETGETVDRYLHVLRKHPVLLNVLGIVKDSDLASELRWLEAELEMAHKDLALAEQAVEPDKALIEALEGRIADLEARVDRLEKQLLAFRRLHER